MSSLKAVLRKKKDRHGNYPKEFPLAIQIVVDRVPAYKQLGKKAALNQWDEVRERVRKSHPNAKRINSLIIKRLAEADKIIANYENNDRPFTAHMVREAMDAKKTKTGSFFEYAIEYFETMRLARNYNRIVSDISAVKHFKVFLNLRNPQYQDVTIAVTFSSDGVYGVNDFTTSLLKGNDIQFRDITVSLLEKFRAYLKGSLHVSERTIFNYLAIIRAIYKQAIKDNTGIADKKYYPFGQGKFDMKKPESLKIGLEKEEVKLLELLDVRSKAHLHHTKNLWLFSFYFAGMRAADVYLMRWSDFQHGRLHYVMGKNNKPGSVKIPDKAQVILNEYEHTKRFHNDLVFPDLKNIIDFTDEIRVKKRIKTVNKRVNANLKTIAVVAGIGKNLSMHISRHSFATISGDRIPLQMLQLLYRHSSITTTIGYQKAFINKGSDEALDTVLDF